MIQTLNLKLRLKPAHIGKIRNILDICQNFHNTLLTEGEWLYGWTGKHPSQGTQEKRIKVYRPDLDPKRAVHTHLLQDVVDRIHLGRAAFFRNIKLGSPRDVSLPKRKEKCRSFSFKEHKNGFRIVMRGEFISKIKISGVGSLPVFGNHRLPKGAEIATATIKEQALGFFIYITYKFTPEEDFPREKSSKKSPLFPHSNIQHKPNYRSSIGIDLGLAAFAATSDGDFFRCPALEERAQELRLLNNQKDRKIRQEKKEKREKESRRLSALKRKIARHHAKTRCVRRDFHRKVVSYLISNYCQIFHEDLDVSKLIIKGEDFGHDHVRRIHSAGWSSFITLLHQRAANTESIVKGVESYWTSCICPYCFHGERKALYQRIHYCSNCGAVEDRDVAAAKIIEIAGLRPERLSVSKARLSLAAREAARRGVKPGVEALASIRV